MLLVVKDQTVVHLIRQTQHVELHTQLGNTFQLLTCEHFTDGVVGRVDNDGFGLWRERFAKLVEIDRPLVA